MTTKLVTHIAVSALAMMLAVPAAQAGPIKSMEHYFRISGAVNAANGSCELRGNIPLLLELGKPFQLKERNPEFEEKMIDVMVQSLNENGARI